MKIPMEYIKFEGQLFGVKRIKINGTYVNVSLDILKASMDAIKGKIVKTILDNGIDYYVDRTTFYGKEKHLRKYIKKHFIYPAKPDKHHM